MTIMEPLEIGILSKRNKGFTGKIKRYYEKKGHSVKIFLEGNLSIDNSLLEKDFYILKSKQLFYLYAAYFLDSNNVIVIPDTYISHIFKNRVESYFSLQKKGFLTPKVYMGNAKSVKSQLSIKEFPLVQKPIMSSGSKDIRIIKSINDLDLNSEEVIYLEKYIEGNHYLVYFIENETCVCEKKPLANEHQKVKIIASDYEIEQLTLQWKEIYKLMFGHLDLIRERSTNKLYIVDVGTFPEFSNWRGSIDPIKAIGDSILFKYQLLKGN
ncbi:MAG: ATP-grasp domain-containing protein [Candidatus Lokiarchaeota archaeon]|nr:ATP-grasp domain-containing protein [Candidatus Lokiarchaeota archaeon]